MGNIFEGRLVRLRAVEIEDWERHYRWDRSTTDDARASYEIPFPASREQAKAWAEREAKNPAQDDAFRFVIERLDGINVGTLNTHTLNKRNGTFMYGLAIAPEYRRGGLASEAIRLVLRYYFWEKRYQKVTSEVFGFNTPSIHLHERLGFTLEGRLRRMIFTGGEFHDALLFGMTREEFEASGWEGLKLGYE